MNRIISATVAAALLAGATPAVASAAEFVRKTEETKTVKETCQWKVDEEGGNPVPVTNSKGEQICVTETVSQPGSSNKAKWADESNRPVIIGTVLGILGALVAGVIGMSLLFIESINIQPLPGLR